MRPTKTKRQEKSCLNIDPDNGSVGTNPSNHPEEEEYNGKVYLCISIQCYKQYRGFSYRYCRRIALGFADLIPRSFREEARLPMRPVLGKGRIRKGDPTAPDRSSHL